MSRAAWIGGAFALAAVGVAFAALSGKRGPRKLTKADIPKLVTLQLLKGGGIGAELRRCSLRVSDAQKHKPQLAIAYAVGMFTGAVTLNPAQALTAARTAAGVINTVWPKGDTCRKEAEQMVRDLELHDRTSDELGLSRDLPVTEIDRLIKELGGLTEWHAQQAAKATSACEASGWGKDFCASDGRGGTVGQHWLDQAQGGPGG